MSGFVGNFSVKIKKKARYVDETKCTGCGLCTEKCPVKNVPNEFNMGMDNRRAVYIPFAKVMVGGAVLNQEYADMIKADFYGKDARAAVEIANKVFGV